MDRILTKTTLEVVFLFLDRLSVDQYQSSGLFKNLDSPF